MWWAAEQSAEVAAGGEQLALGDATVGVGHHGGEELGKPGIHQDLGVRLGGSEGPQRWSELRRRAVGISEKMLAQTLKALENDGLVHRDAQPVIPPRVDYSLTDRGEELAALLLPLVEWVAEHADDALATES